MPKNFNICLILIGTTLNFGIATKWFLAHIYDETNQSTAFAYITTSRSVGMILGQILGGFVSFPAHKYPSIFKADGIFGSFKILLPNLVIAIGMSIVGIAAWRLLPRDESRTSENDPTIEELLNETEEKTDKTTNIKLFSVLREKNVRLVALAIFIWVTVLTSFNELIPLYLSTSLIYGGGNYNTSQIGMLLFLAMIPTIPIELFVNKKAGQKFGAKKMLIWASVGTSILTPLLPIVHFIHKNSYGAYVYIIIYNIIGRILQSCGFTGLGILSINSVTPERQGTLSGLMLLICSVGRAFGPFVLGSSYAWSLGNIAQEHISHLGFPFNQYFAFILLSIMTYFIPLVCFFVPESLNFPQGGTK